MLSEIVWCITSLFSPQVKTMFETGGPDGLTVDPVNQVLYAEVGGQIVGYQISNGVLVFQSGAIAGGPDGAALGEGALSGTSL